MWAGSLLRCPSQSYSHIWIFILNWKKHRQHLSWFFFYGKLMGQLQLVPLLLLALLLFPQNLDIDLNQQQAMEKLFPPLLPAAVPQFRITSRVDGPKIHYQPGVVERKNRHIAEVCRSMMHAKNLPSVGFWVERIKTAVHVITIDWHNQSKDLFHYLRKKLWEMKAVAYHTERERRRKG